MHTQFFIPTFCINLKSRKDRLKEFNEQVRQANIKVEKFSAIKIPNNPARGCALSHKGILKKCLHQNTELALVLEDDIKIEHPKIFLTELKKILENLPDDWYILYLWGLIGRNGKVQKVNQYCSRVRNFMCTYAVVYNKKSYKTLIAAIDEPQINKYMDDGWDRWLGQVFQSMYPCYSSNKILISERASFSNIDKKYKKTALWYKIRFFFYKNKFWFMLNIIWYLWDKLGVSHRAREPKVQI